MPPGKLRQMGKKAIGFVGRKVRENYQWHIRNPVNQVSPELAKLDIKRFNALDSKLNRLLIKRVKTVEKIKLAKARQAELVAQYDGLQVKQPFFVKLKLKSVSKKYDRLSTQIELLTKSRQQLNQTITSRKGELETLKRQLNAAVESRRVANDLARSAKGYSRGAHLFGFNRRDRRSEIAEGMRPAAHSSNGKHPVASIVNNSPVRSLRGSKYSFSAQARMINREVFRKKRFLVPVSN